MKFWHRIWILERKLGSWPSKVWWFQDAPLRRYKRMKNEISTGDNRKFSVVNKNFNFREWIFQNLFKISSYVLRIPILNFQDEKLKKCSTFFIKANFEILTTDLHTRAKIRALTLQSLGVQDAPLGSYKRLKNEISKEGNRKIQYFSNISITNGDFS